MGAGCNFSRDRLYDSSIIDDLDRRAYEIKWGKASAAAVGQLNIAWVAGGGKDAADPSGNYPTKELNTFVVCARTDLSGIDTIMGTINAYVDLPDPDDYAEIKLAVNGRVIYKSRIDNVASSDSFKRIDFGPWDLTDQVDLSDATFYIDFKTDGDGVTGKGIWIDWIQARQYDEQLFCGFKNLETDIFKGLNISSIDPSTPNESALLIRPVIMTIH